MAQPYIDVLLISDDERLCERMRHHCPPRATLQCLGSAELNQAQNLIPRQTWIDLDAAAGNNLPTTSRRVYFHSPDNPPAPDTLPPGTFIRKPPAPTTCQILWASVQEKTPAPPPPLSNAPLPAWLLQYHELDLRKLCQRLVTNLPGQLGYQNASLYLHDQARELLTLAGTTHNRDIDLIVSTRTTPQSLMVAAATETGQILHTDHVADEFFRRGLEPPPARQYNDERCLIAPLVHARQLLGVINLSGRTDDADESPDDTIQTTFNFIATALHHARTYDQASTEARVDSLTGLFNKRWMNEALNREIRRAQRYNIPLATLLIDVDGLKRINDREGHAAGDALLKHVARCISGILRQFDGAARVGGDEYVVMLPRTDLNGAQQVGHRLIEAIRSNPAVIRMTAVPVSVSVGAAEWRPGWSTEQLLTAADDAMYRAKRRGPNQLHCQTHAGEELISSRSADATQSLDPTPQRIVSLSPTEYIAPDAEQPLPGPNQCK